MAHTVHPHPCVAARMRACTPALATHILPCPLIPTLSIGCSVYHTVRGQWVPPGAVSRVILFRMRLLLKGMGLDHGRRTGGRQGQGMA